MKTCVLRRVAVGFGFITACASLFAGNYTNNFDDGVYDPFTDPPPEGARLLGSSPGAVIEASGGFSGGALKITKAGLPGYSGAFVIDDLDNGEEVNAFTVTFKVRVGGGTNPPADGWSFCFAPDLPFPEFPDGNGAWGEEGTGSGLIVAFDTYDNGGGEAPAITVRFDGVQVAEVKPGLDALITGENGTPLWADARIQLYPDGTLDVELDGVFHYNRLPLPFTSAIAGGKFGFGARTGGSNANHFIDDLSIVTEQGPLRAGFVHQPQSSTFIVGQPVHFHALLVTESEDVVLGYQWERQSPSGGAFTPIPGATSRDYVGPAATMADDGAKYRLAVFDQAGTIYSNEVTLTVIEWPAVTYSHTFGFSSPPQGGTIYGTAEVDVLGQYLVLTYAENNQQGSFILNDLNDGAAIAGIDVAFDMLMSQGGDPDPEGVVVADGMSFNWAPDVIEDAAPVEGNAEHGSGSGLRLCFDVYDNVDANPYNGRGEAPALLLKWGNTVLDFVPVTPAELNTGIDFVPVLVRLTAEGKVSVAVNGRVYFQDVEVPNWAGFSGAKFAFYARTGGANQQHFIDELKIATEVYSGAVQIVSEPADAVVVAGQMATFSVTANYNVPPATVRWQRKGPSDADFADIPGATSTVYTTPAVTLADHGARYRALVQIAPGNSATTREAVLSVVDFSHTNPQVVLNFNDGTLANTGSASAVVPEAQTVGVQAGESRELIIQVDGGPDNSAFLILTDAANDQGGVLFVPNHAGEAAQGALTATFDVHFGMGSNPPADGFSFNWGADVAASTAGTAEEGVGTGLSVTFDVYGSDAPRIGIKYKGAFVIDQPVPASVRPPDWAPVGIRVSNDGKVDVMLDNVVYLHQIQLPDWQGITNGNFSIFARTGGLNQNHWIDNVTISTSNYVGPLVITRQPASTAVLYGTTATFTVEVNDPSRASYTWETAPAGSTNFAPIPGVTGPTYTTAAVTAADNGRQYRVVVTGGSSPVTSNVAVLAAVDPTLPPPTAALDFDNPTSLSYLLIGSAFEEDFDGIDGSRTAKLTLAENSLQGSLLIDDFNDGASIASMIAEFYVAVGGGSNPPADGFSFVWGPDVNTSMVSFGEEGAGTGLIVSFDTYANGGGDETGITVRWEGEAVAEYRMPYAELLSPSFPDYFRVVVKVDEDGTIDVWYGNRVIFHDLPIPAYRPLAGAGFGWGARTGGLNENMWIDNISLTVGTASVPADGISIQRSGGNLIISFDGVLQQSTDFKDWQDVPGQTNPYVIPLPTSGQRFYRVR